jgi:uncharacterized integral membrane protein
MGPVTSSSPTATVAGRDARAADDFEPAVGRRHGRSVRPAAAGSRAWVAFVPAIVGLVAILVFVLQNLHQSDVRFLSLSGSAPLGLALLAAAVLGGLVALCLGSVRNMQRRRLARRR